MQRCQDNATLAEEERSEGEIGRKLVVKIGDLITMSGATAVYISESPVRVRCIP